jgi:hypothetical protein
MNNETALCPIDLRSATFIAIDYLRQAIREIYNDDNPQLTIHMMDGRAARVRRAIARLEKTQ